MDAAPSDGGTGRIRHDEGVGRGVWSIRAPIGGAVSDAMVGSYFPCCCRVVGCWSNKLAGGWVRNDVINLGIHNIYTVCIFYTNSGISGRLLRRDLSQATRSRDSNQREVPDGRLVCPSSDRELKS